MTTLPIAKEIVYDRESREYAIYVTIDGQRECRECIGYSKTYHEGEIKADDYAYHYYSDNHTPEVAAAIAVEGFGPESPLRHTPGPWHIKPVSYPDRAHPQIYAGDKRIAEPCNSADVPAPESDYNARLIAATPELFDALHATLRVLSELENRWSEEADRAIAQARAAIAKASPGGA